MPNNMQQPPHPYKNLTFSYRPQLKHNKLISQLKKWWGKQKEAGRMTQHWSHSSAGDKTNKWTHHPLDNCFVSASCSMCQKKVYKNTDFNYCNILSRSIIANDDITCCLWWWTWFMPPQPAAPRGSLGLYFFTVPARCLAVCMKASLFGVTLVSPVMKKATHYCTPNSRQTRDEQVKIMEHFAAKGDIHINLGPKHKALI